MINVKRVHFYGKCCFNLKQMYTVAIISLFWNTVTVSTLGLTGTVCYYFQFAGYKTLQYFLNKLNACMSLDSEQMLLKLW